VIKATLTPHRGLPIRGNDIHLSRVAETSVVEHLELFLVHY